MPNVFRRVSLAATALFRSPAATAAALRKVTAGHQATLVGTFPTETSPLVGAFLGGAIPGSRGEPPPRGRANYLAAYSTMPWLRAVSDRVAWGVAAVPWQVLAVKGKGGKFVRDAVLQRADGPTRQKMLARHKAAGDLVELVDHPLYELLHGGNDMMTGGTVRALTVLYLDLVGEAFFIKQRNGASAPVGLWPLAPNWVQATPTPARRKYDLQVEGWRDAVDDTEVLWLKRADPANPYARGTGIAQSLADELETDEYTAKMTKARMWNRAAPDVLISPKDTKAELKKEQVDRMEQSWLQKVRGLWKQGGTLFSPRAVEVQTITPTFRELQLVELRQFERDTIVQVYGIPPEKLGILTNSNRACYDDQTECLTDRGWVRHGDLQLTDRVAAYDAVARTLRFEHPKQIVRYRHDGDMLHFASQEGARGRRGNVDIMVTPDHRMLLRPSSHEGLPWTEKRAEEVEHHLPRRWQTVVAAPLEGEAPKPLEFAASATRPNKRPAVKIPVEVWAPMLGLLASEGTWGRYNTSNPGGATSYQISVSQSLRANPAKVDAIDELISRFPIPCSRYVDADEAVRWQWNHQAMLEHLEQHCGPASATRRLPAYVREWPGWAQRSLIEWAILGDGTPVGQPAGANPDRRTWGSWQLYSTSPGLMDDYQEAALKAGYRAGAVRVGYEGDARRATCYRIGISEHVEPELPVPVRRPYSGTVWCLETSTGWFVTRRNGCIAIQGNTIEGADLIFGKDLVVPRCEFLREHYQERLAPEYDERLIVQYVSPVAEDQDRQLEAGKSAPWSRKANEWRAAQGLEPDERLGDGYYVPIGMRFVADPAEDEGGIDPSVTPAATTDDQEDEDGEKTADAASVIAKLARSVARAAVFRAGTYNAKAIALDDDYYTLVHRVADKLTPKLRRQFMQAIGKIQDATLITALENAFASGQLAAAEAAIPWAQLEAQLHGGTEIIRQALYAAGEAAASELSDVLGVALKFDRTNPAAEAWAAANAARYVTEITEHTRAAMRTMIADAYADQMTAPELARLVRGSIGLRSEQAAAVARFRAELVANGVGGERLDKLVAKRARRYLNQRATTIARTELIQASNMGQQMLWRQAAAKGHLDASIVVRRWLATDDDRCDATCLQMDGQSAPLDEEFRTPAGDPYLTPPVHPNCRCAVGLELLR